MYLLPGLYIASRSRGATLSIIIVVALRWKRASLCYYADSGGLKGSTTNG